MARHASQSGPEGSFLWTALYTSYSVGTSPFTVADRAMDPSALRIPLWYIGNTRPRVCRSTKAPPPTRWASLATK